MRFSASNRRSPRSPKFFARASANRRASGEVRSMSLICPLAIVTLTVPTTWFLAPLISVSRTISSRDSERMRPLRVVPSRSRTTSWSPGTAWSRTRRGTKNMELTGRNIPRLDAGALCRDMLLLLLAAVLAQSAPYPPQEAAGNMTVPEGFKVQLFAGEPDIVQPMAFTFDDRGRLWVVECLSYPRWLPPGQEGRDRILIFEDTDGDGKFDTKKVFADKLANVSGIAVGHGGVWLTALPHLLFIPVRNGGDVPDGPPEIVLDGWDMKAKHNVFNKPS